LKAGFVDELVPAYAMKDAVQRHCIDLVQLDSASFAANKRRINAQWVEPMAIALEADIAEFKSFGIAVQGN
jgi:hypothetical protein